MTTRHRLSRSVTQAVILIACVMVAGAVYDSHLLRLSTFHYLFVSLCFGVIGALLWNACQTHCVHCRQPLGATALKWIMRRSPLERGEPCPHCGISIDRELPYG